MCVCVQPHHPGPVCAGSPGSKQRSSNHRSRQQERPTQQLQDLRRALQDLQPDSYSDRHEAQQLPEHVARIAMRDPLGVLISSLGVPLGISLKVNRSEVLQQHAENSRRCVRTHVLVVAARLLSELHMHSVMMRT